MRYQLTALPDGFQGYNFSWGDTLGRCRRLRNQVHIMVSSSTGAQFIPFYVGQMFFGPDGRSRLSMDIELW
jgi:hypothetical protein